jgi:hypothetical protein
MQTQIRRQKPFPDAPNKLRNYTYKRLIEEYKRFDYDVHLFKPVYETIMTEFSKRIRDEEQVNVMKRKIDDYSVQDEVARYERKLARNEWTVQIVESDITIGLEYDDFLNMNVGLRVMSHIDGWKQKYGKPLKELQAFTQDNQNVHTKVVSDTMNDGINILNAIPVPKNQKTLDEIMTAFTNELGYTNVHAIYDDMKKWGKVSEIYKKDDYLYRQSLRGLWAKINTYSGDIRKELLKRLYEECQESVDMCATGHISRLTNVLVGFDEAFKPVISMEEQFQNAMAKISLTDCFPEEKVAMAQKIMEEMNIPLESRQVWLDAF